MKNKNISFSFSFVTKKTILNELRKLNPKKSCQESNIPVKIIKENLDLSATLFTITSIILCSVQTPVILKNCKHNVHLE